MRGFKDVFSFTLIQTMKSKAYKTTIIITVIMALLSMPILTLINGNSMGKVAELSNGTEISKVYVLNDTGTSITLPKSIPAFPDAEVVPYTGAYELGGATGLDETLSEDKGALLVYLYYDMYEFYINIRASQETIITETAKNSLAETLREAVIGSMTKSTGSASVSKDLVKELAVEYNISHVQLKDLNGKEDTSISQNEYWFIYALLFVVLMICVMSGSAIANSIVTEKTSRVIEYLLTSVKPMAIIVGKVLASMLSTIIQMAIVIIAIGLSSKVTGLVTGNTTNMLSSILSPDIIKGLNPLNIIVSLIVMALGIVFYATLAGLCGATASKVEDAGESLTLFTFTSIIGAYIGIGASASLMAAGDNAFVTFALICPISSPFLLPGAMAIGKTNIGLILIAIAVLILSIYLLFLFVSKVFETLILHNGSRLKVKDVIKIFKMSKKGGKANE